MPSSVINSAVETGGSRAAADWSLERRPYGWYGQFRAMASPCEVHLSGVGRGKAEGIVGSVCAEAKRLEAKFSRYLEGNIVDRINRANAQAVCVDPETARLLDYAAELNALSDGRFDVTSGILRRAWTFDGGETVPAAETVASLLPKIGWQQVEWANPVLRMPAGMEIDFGGIGKEYAVDRAAKIAADGTTRCMINFGGDLVALGPPEGRDVRSRRWNVGIESFSGGSAQTSIALTRGALATSGDARRFVLKDGKRYGHILDARSGWPVVDAPRSVTVLASTCTEAGMLATFAMLMGAQAESFLNSQSVRYWCQR